MNPSYGEFDAALTKAVRAVARGDSTRIRFRLPHALQAMEDDGFDHFDVLTCLRKGNAFGPEVRGGELRANVVHRGLHLRVVVAGLDNAHPDWSRLDSMQVVTVMRVV